MMAGSDCRCSEAGGSLPRDAWTMDMESSTLTDCVPVARTSCSRRRRPVRYSNAAISLHVRVAAERANTRACFAEIAPQQQEARDLPHVRRALAVLRDAHAVADYSGIRLGVRLSDALQGALG